MDQIVKFSRRQPSDAYYVSKERTHHHQDLRNVLLPHQTITDSNRFIEIYSDLKVFNF